MTACEFNDSRGLKPQLRNINIAVTWYPPPEDLEKRVQAGFSEFTLLVFGLALSSDR